MHIYLDNNATTPLDPRVLDAMVQELRGPPANPSSIHAFGQQARRLLSNARHSCASYFQVKPEEVIFTSGGSESLNLLLAAAGILTGSFVVETIFQIPGLARFFVTAAFNRDYTLVLGTVIVVAALVILFNLIVDLLYGVVDPRVRHG